MFYKKKLILYRYTDPYMFQVAILHGTSKTDLDSYLKPIVQELQHLSTKGMIVQKNSEVVARARVVPLMVTGDIPGVAKILHHTGHASYYGCRFCTTRGSPGANGRGMYFEKRNCPLRTKESLTPNAETVEANFKRNDNPDNITMANVFFNTWSFLGVEFFGLDEMHLISNVAKQLYNLLTTSNNSKFCPPSCLSKDYPFNLDNSDFTVIQKSMDESRCNIPLAFSGCFKGINEKSTNGYRSVDWLDFLMYAVPTLVVPLLHSKSTQDAVSALVRACGVALQWEITEDELQEMNR